MRPHEVKCILLQHEIPEKLTTTGRKELVRDLSPSAGIDLVGPASELAQETAGDIDRLLEVNPPCCRPFWRPPQNQFQFSLSRVRADSTCASKPST